MNDTTITPEETREEPSAENTTISTPAVSEQPDPVKELEAVRTGTVSVHAEDYARDLAFQQQVGRVQGFQAAASGLSLAVIQWFSAMKASGEYKGRSFTDQRGNIHQPQDFEELCEAMGVSKNTVYESLQNYARSARNA